MRLIIVCSLVLAEGLNPAQEELQDFITFHKDLPEDYQESWSHKGIRNFVKNREMDEDSKGLLLRLIDLLDSKYSQDKAQELEQYLDSIEMSMTSTGRPPR